MKLKVKGSLLVTQILTSVETELIEEVHMAMCFCLMVQLLVGHQRRNQLLHYLPVKLNT
jgi:hypothetical protein